MINIKTIFLWSVFWRKKNVKAKNQIGICSQSGDTTDQITLISFGTADGTIAAALLGSCMHCCCLLMVSFFVLLTHGW
jgi:hypothetical protein